MIQLALIATHLLLIVSRPTSAGADTTAVDRELTALSSLARTTLLSADSYVTELRNAATDVARRLAMVDRFLDADPRRASLHHIRDKLIQVSHGEIERPSPGRFSHAAYAKTLRQFIYDMMDLNARNQRWPTTTEGKIFIEIGEKMHAVLLSSTLSREEIGRVARDLEDFLRFVGDGKLRRSLSELHNLLIETVKRFGSVDPNAGELMLRAMNAYFDLRQELADSDPSCEWAFLL